VYSTHVYTITSCAASVTDCPAKIGKVTTDIISLYTTVCPVTATETGVLSSTVSVAAGNKATPYTVSTVYSTTIYAVTSCESTATDCSAKIGETTTELISLYATYVPASTEAVSTSEYTVYPEVSTPTTSASYGTNAGSVSSGAQTLNPAVTPSVSSTPSSSGNPAPVVVTGAGSKATGSTGVITFLAAALAIFL
jgi:chitinase